MPHRTATLSPLLGLIAALTIAVPALAKEGAEARLDTTLPRDAEPGATIDVGWSVFSIVADTSYPMSATSVYIRLVGVDGTSSTEVVGTERPLGSGHYTAAIQVPDGGIGQVIVGLKGESCSRTEGCSRMDMIFPLTDDPLVSGAAPVRSAPVARAAPSGAPISAQLAPLVAIGVAVAIAGGVAALIIGRRRAVEAPGR